MGGPRPCSCDDRRSDVSGDEVGGDDDLDASGDVGTARDDRDARDARDDRDAVTRDDCDAVTRDAGTCDAGTRDAGTRDAGTCDAGTCDAGTCDVGTCDAGTCDAGIDRDTRVHDTITWHRYDHQRRDGAGDPDCDAGARGLAVRAEERAGAFGRG